MIASEWRAHFHVPIFVEKFGLLASTRDEIVDVLVDSEKIILLQNTLKLKPTPGKYLRMI